MKKKDKKQLINTIYFDIEYIKDILIDNEIWIESSNDYVPLDKTARQIILDTIDNYEFIIERLRG